MNKNTLLLFSTTYSLKLLPTTIFINSSFFSGIGSDLRYGLNSPYKNLLIKLVIFSSFISPAISNFLISLSANLIILIVSYLSLIPIYSANFSPKSLVKADFENTISFPIFFATFLNYIYYSDSYSESVKKNIVLNSSPKILSAAGLSKYYINGY